MPKIATVAVLGDGGLDGFGKAKKKSKATKRCPYGKVQAGPRKNKCRLRPIPGTTKAKGEKFISKWCKNGPVIQYGPRRGMCPTPAEAARRGKQIAKGKKRIAGVGGK